MLLPIMFVPANYVHVTANFVMAFFLYHHVSSSPLLLSWLIATVV